MLCLIGAQGRKEKEWSEIKTIMCSEDTTSHYKLFNCVNITRALNNNYVLDRVKRKKSEKR